MSINWDCVDKCMVDLVISMGNLWMLIHHWLVCNRLIVIWRSSCIVWLMGSIVGSHLVCVFWVLSIIVCIVFTVFWVFSIVVGIVLYVLW